MIDLKIEHVENIIADFVDVVESDAAPYKRRGYVFSQWVTIKAGKAGTMRLVLPDVHFLQKWERAMGYGLQSLQPKKSFSGPGWNWVANSDPQGRALMSFEAIAGFTTSPFAIANPEKVF